MENYSFALPTACTIQKFQFIDNLRAIAILLVIFHHIGEMFYQADYIRIFSPWGRHGVQLFFVMSAFTLCYTGSNLALTFKQLISFYAKRFFRIAPLYYIAIAAYYLVAIATSGAYFYSSLGSMHDYTFVNVLANILFINGLYPAGNNNIVPGGWSIGCEMLFYLAFPFLLYLVRTSKSYLVIFQMLAWSLVWLFLEIAKLYDHHGVGGISSFAYYFIANQLSAFLLGISLFFFWQSEAYFKGLLYSSVIVLILLCAAGYVYPWLSAWIWVVMPLITGMISCLLAKGVSKIKINKVFGELGKVSYSMYILHFVFLWIIGEFVRKIGIPIDNDLLALLFYLVVVFLTFWFAKLSYNFIETPFIKAGKSFISYLFPVND